MSSSHSAQTLAVLAALSVRPTHWQHGYELAKQTRLKSGTLYPILIRLADRGLLEAAWEDDQPAGRPRRHLYRLTAAGVAEAEQAQAKQAQARQAQQTRHASASAATARTSKRAKLAMEGA